MYIAYIVDNRISREEFLVRAKKKHGDTYDYSATKFTGIKKKIIVICRIHGEFEQKAETHLRGSGCPKCGRRKSDLGRRKTNADFIEQATQVHGDTFDYSKVDYKTNSSHVTIICRVHGEWKQTPSNHLSGFGCPKCANNERKSTKQFIEDALFVHGDKYDYTETVYNNNKTKVRISCKVHGPFEQLPNNHLDGQGCVKCTKPGLILCPIHNVAASTAYKNKNYKCRCEVCKKWQSIRGRMNREKSIASYRKKGREREKKRRQRNPLGIMISNSKARAKRDNLPFDIDSNYLFEIADTKCPILGIELIYNAGTGFNENSASLDKIDPAKGYVKGNVMIVSQLANSMKRNASKEQLLRFSKFWLENAEQLFD